MQVGVVGRTGSGKTTLLMALFRMFELAYGRIVIDGQNIAAIPLAEVRAPAGTRVLWRACPFYLPAFWHEGCDGGSSLYVRG